MYADSLKRILKRTDEKERMYRGVADFLESEKSAEKKWICMGIIFRGKPMQ